MKKLFTLVIFLIMVLTKLSAQCFTKNWDSGTDFMNFYITKATLNGINLQPGDQIGIFDGNACVGVGTLTQELTGGSVYLSIVTADNSNALPLGTGFEEGNPVTFKLCANGATLEIDNVQPNYTYFSGATGQTAGNFYADATAVVELTGSAPFTITTSSNPPEGGTTSGDGQYDIGTPATVIAAPAEGYQFVNWTEAGAPVSADASYTFTVTASRTLVANFSQITYTITTSSNPANGGTTSGGGTYASGASATVVAAPAEGYQFVNWTEAGAPVSADASYTFTVTASRTLVANFSQITYTITTSSNPANGGTTSGGGTYASGASATVVAAPAEGYQFVNWTEAGAPVSADASYTFTVTASRTLVANFSQITYTITTSSNPANGGTTSGGGTYASGASATVVAAPAEGYQFVNWTEAGAPVSADASYTFTVTASRTLVANFSQITYTITTSSNPANGGTTSGGGTYASGASATVVAAPAEGYQFVNWTEAGAPVSADASYTFTVTASRTLVANFSQITYTITTSSNPANGGTTSGGGTYASGASATVVAAPAEGYQFVNWTEAGAPVSADASYTFTVTASRTLVANFSQITYTITTSSNPANGGTTSGGGTYASGASATVVAAPAEGYQFVNWTEAGAPVSADASYTFTVTASRTLVANFSQITYTITTSSNPANGGTTSGGGTYASGASATVVAAPAEGYQFVNWTEAGAPVSADASYTFTVTASRTLVANFSQITYTITTSSNPANGGTTSGGGTYASGASATVVAAPAEGYQFVNWTEAGAPVSADASYTFTVTASRTLVANFSQITYTITTSSNPANGGTTSGGGTYASGASATVVAAPAEGYQFVNWTEAGAPVSADASYTFTVTASRTLVANFSQITYTITTSSNPANGGTTSGGGTYASGASATVVAAPAEGYQFVNWTEAGAPVSADASYTFTVTASRTLVANFSQITYTITTSSNPANGGTTSGGGTYASGASATVVAAPAEGYQFVNWTEAGAPVSADASYTFTVTASRTLVANFSQITYTITTSSNPANGGTTSGGGTYASGASATVVAAPAEGYQFVNWTEAGAPVSADASYTFTVTASRTLVANFSQITYTITTSSNPANGGTTSGGGTYASGASATVVAAPAEGYQFVNWTEAGAPVSADASYTFTVTASRTLVANFSQITYTITTSSNPANGGTTSGGGTYASGASATVVAAPAEGYQFVNWTEAGAPVSADASYTFTVTASRTLVANFSQITYTITTSSNPANGGTTSGGGTYASGASATVVAAPAEGYQFVNWTEAGAPVSADASYTFTVTASRTLVANFSQITYTITTSSNPANGGTTSGGGTYASGASATVVAAPAEGYQFVNWTEAGAPVSADASYTFTVTASRTLVANFSQITYTITTSSNPANGGTTSGGGTYASGASATVVAAPAEGYQFVNWTEAGAPVSADASYTFTVTASRTLVANFSQITYTITTSSNPANGGTTSGGGTYASGASATVVAAPAEGYQFVNWTEAGAPVSADASYTFTVTASRTLVANFSQITYTITTSSNPANGGTTSGGGTYASGASATVVAAPAEGYQFVNWTEAGAPVSADASYTFTVTASRTLVANFSQITYTITTSSNPANGGTTSGGGTYASGASATVVAAPAEGYQFVNWTEAGAPVSADASYTFTVTASRTLVANFSQITYTITTSSNPANGGTTSGGGTYASGASATVVAAPAEGYQFVNWTEAGAPVSADASYTFTVTASRTLVANFSQITYTITTSSNPANGGTTSGGGTYASGASATVVAAPAEGYQFVNWTEAGAPVSADASYTFTVTASRTLVANFSMATYICHLVTGGGYINLTSASSGEYPGAPGTKMDFAIVVNNKIKGWNWWFNWYNYYDRFSPHKTLKGNLIVFYKGTDKSFYHIKSKEIKSLEVVETKEGTITYYVATITAVANLTKISPRKKNQEVGKDLNLVIRVWDRKDRKDGKFDRIGVQLSGYGNSGLYFSSNWNNDLLTTTEQILAGGNIDIDLYKNLKSDRSLKELNIGDKEFETAMGDAEDVKIEVYEEAGEIKGPELGITAYPNPFTDHVYFELTLKTDSKVRLEVYDFNGSKLSTLYDDVVLAFNNYRFEYTPANIKTGALIYRLIIDGNIAFTGKLIRD